MLGKFVYAQGLLTTSKYVFKKHRIMYGGLCCYQYGGQADFPRLSSLSSQFAERRVESADVCRTNGTSAAVLSQREFRGKKGVN